MASYNTDFARSALKDLRRLDRRVVPRIVAEIEALRDDPRPDGCRKLVGSQDLYRIRVGDYRVVYSVNDCLLTVGIERVRHRKEVYD